MFAGFVLGLLLVISPWTVRNGIALRRPTPTTTHGGYTLLLGNNPFFYEHLRRGPWFHAWHAEPFHGWWRAELRVNHLLEHDEDGRAPLRFHSPSAELEADALAYRHAFASMRAEPGMFAWSCLVRAGHFWSPLPFRLSPDESLLRRAGRYGVAVWYAIAFALATVGTYFMLFGRETIRRKRSLVLWSLLLALVLTGVHTFYWSNLRMRAPLMPLVAIAAAHGAQKLLRPQRCPRKRQGTPIR